MLSELGFDKVLTLVAHFPGHTPAAHAVSQLLGEKMAIASEANHITFRPSL